MLSRLHEGTMKMITIRLDDALWEKLKILAIKRQISLQELFITAVKEKFGDFDSSKNK
jgi:predicted transcriptional regulator